MGSLTHEDAVAIFHEQAEGLKAGGADVLWVETISAPEEFRAAAEAAALAGMPWCGTMSFDTAGRTMMGLTSAALVSLVEKLPVMTTPSWVRVQAQPISIEDVIARGPWKIGGHELAKAYAFLRYVSELGMELDDFLGDRVPVSRR